MEHHNRLTMSPAEYISIRQQEWSSGNPRLLWRGRSHVEAVWAFLSDWKMGTQTGDDYLLNWYIPSETDRLRPFHAVSTTVRIVGNAD